MIARGRIELLILALCAFPTWAQAKPLVVIDAGHGGERAGARHHGVEEKSIVLKVARHARDALKAAGARVIMTRDGDQHVSLSGRIDKANQANADVFVSIHANSAPVSGRRGCETYIVSAEASDDVSEAMLHLENDGEEDGRFVNDEEFGGGLTRKKGDVDFILADLRRAVTHKASARLANALQERMGTVKALLPSRGLRQAPFKVLRLATMPAALVEIGYVSNAVQSRSLNTKLVQLQTGKAIAKGVMNYLATRTKLARRQP